MSEIHSANNALIKYIDALLVDDIAGEEGSYNIASSPDRLHDDVKNQAVDSNPLPNPDLLNLLFLKAGGVPLAISHSVIEAIVAIRRGDLQDAVAINGLVGWEFNHGRDAIHVVDMRSIILPNGHQARQYGSDQDEVHIIVLNKGPHGLLCDEIGASMAIEPRQVDWRMQRSSRKWLAGMVREYNHALLDEKEIIKICNQG